jgi:hypothetical protein
MEFPWKLFTLSLLCVVQLASSQSPLDAYFNGQCYPPAVFIVKSNRTLSAPLGITLPYLAMVPNMQGIANTLACSSQGLTIIAYGSNCTFSPSTRSCVTGNGAEFTISEVYALNADSALITTGFAANHESSLFQQAGHWVLHSFMLLCIYFVFFT